MKLKKHTERISQPIDPSREWWAGLATCPPQVDTEVNPYPWGGHGDLPRVDREAHPYLWRRYFGFAGKNVRGFFE
jgi:hypothetical protein